MAKGSRCAKSAAGRGFFASDWGVVCGSGLSVRFLLNLLRPGISTAGGERIWSREGFSDILEAIWSPHQKGRNMLCMMGDEGLGELFTAV